MKPLRIGFDAKRAFCNFTGLGNYSRSLLQNLHSAYPEVRQTLFSPRITRRPETGCLLSGEYEVVAPRRSFLWRSLFIKSDPRFRSLDLYHGLSHELPLFGSPAGLKYVVTVCDLIYAFFPNDFTAIDRRIYHFKTKSACIKADRIVTISESTKNDVVKFYGIDPDKIDVVYPACDDRFAKAVSPDARQSVLATYGITGPYLLYVGSIIERKNLGALVKALALMPPETTLPLFVIGNGKRYKQDVVREIAAQHLEHRVRFLPPVKTDDLPALYQSAEMLVYPSVYEGFGLPLTEALYSGIPVITSQLSSLPEAAGPGGLYADPHSPKDLAEKIGRLLADKSLRERLVTEGRRHVEKFNGRATAEALMRSYEKTLG